MGQSIFKKAGPPKITNTEALEDTFVPDGQLLSGGGIRYKILCDGGINPSGVFWAKTVPAGASIDDYKAAQAERDAKLKELHGLA